jgi:hypothetical protein
VREDNYDRRVNSARFGGGVFKLGRKLPNGSAAFFSSAELAGDLGCRRGAGPGRRLDVAAPSGFTVESWRVRTSPLYVNNRPAVARYTITDRCNKTTVVQSRAGRVYVRDHNRRTPKVLTGRQTYVTRPR